MTSALPIQNHSSIQEALHTRAIEVASRYQKAEIELLEILEQVENHKVYLHQGCSSLFQYGVQQLHLSESVVYNLITVMRKARDVPQLKEEIKQGNITLSNARRIVPLLNNQNHSEWIKKASELSQRQLEKEIVKIHPITATPERAKYVTESRIKLELGLAEKQMMKLRRSQDLVSQSESKHASLEETIVALTEFYLKHKDPVTKAKRVYVKKGLPDYTLAQQKEDATSDNELVSIQAPKRAMRESIPATILHQVNLRDQRKCTHPNPEGKPCGQSRWTEIHHIIPVSHGGKNEIANLTTLCSAHHRMIHSKK